MLLSAHQPHYWPWLGYLDKLLRADAFVILDTCDYRPKYFQNRVQVRTADGWVWMTIPVEKHRKPINAMRITGEFWVEKHRKTIETYYSRAAHFEEYRADLAEFWQNTQGCFNMAEVVIFSVLLLKCFLGITTSVYRASELKADGHKDDWILNVCRELGADRYLSGINGKGYMDEEKFRQAGIEIVYQDFRHPAYRQCFGREFVPGLTGLDAVLNVGGEATREMLREA